MAVPVAIALVLLLAYALSAADEFEDGYQSLTVQIEKARAAWSAVQTYSFEVTLEERRDGAMRPPEYVTAYFVKQPQQMAFYWHDGTFKGLAATHIESRDGERRLEAKPTGAKRLLGLQHLDVESNLIKFFYPHHLWLTQYQIGFITDRIFEVHTNARRLGKQRITDLGVKPASRGRQLHYWNVEMSSDPADGLYYGRVVLGFDTASQLPLFVETYDFEGNIYDRCDIYDLRLNGPIDPAVFVLK